MSETLIGHNSRDFARTSAIATRRSRAGRRVCARRAKGAAYGHERDPHSRARTGERIIPARYLLVPFMEPVRQREMYSLKVTSWVSRTGAFTWFVT